MIEHQGPRDELPDELRDLETELRAGRPQPRLELRGIVLDATRRELARERRVSWARFAAAAALVLWGSVHGIRGLVSMESGSHRFGAGVMGGQIAGPSNVAAPDETRLREIAEITPGEGPLGAAALAWLLEDRFEWMSQARRRAAIERGSVLARSGS